MKNIRFISFVLFLGTLLLSACGARAATPTSTPEAAAGGKVEAMPVAFVGIVDRMEGDQWVISGTKVTVDASIVRDGPFHVGDQVKVEGNLHPDGSFTVTRVEAPRPQETATVPSLSDDNSNDALINGNTNDANINDDHGNDANINDDHGNDVNTNDDHGSSVNSNDDNSSAPNSNASNTNDDHSGNTNSNDNHGGSSSNDNPSGGGSGNNNGSDDHGGNGNDG